MTVWLVCPSCGGIKEWLNAQTPIVHCECGAARHAEDDAGVPQVLWSEPLDPYSFDISAALEAEAQKKKKGGRK